MIKSIFFKLTNAILIISLIYAGSFVFIEESAEKTENTEKPEALHRSYHSNTPRKSPAGQPKEKHQVNVITSKKWEIPLLEHEVLNDFNVNYIYTTSYLDMSFNI